MVANPVQFEKFHTVLETHGVSIPFYPHVITPVIYDAIRAGRFEAEEAAELPFIVEEGDRVLEIGAGIGFISTLIGRDPRVERVFAYEANPRLMDFIAEVHALNGVQNVEARNAVLTNDGDAAKTFYLREDFWMGSLSAGPNPFQQIVRVPTENLNRMLRRDRVSLIVCDVEGAEEFLFQDLEPAGVTRIYLELHDHITGLNGIAKLFSAMQAKGFAYDPRHSSRSIVLFRRVEAAEVLRPYAVNTAPRLA